MKKNIEQQHDFQDCAPVCLAAICNYYGYYNSINFFRELTKTSNNGTNIFNIVEGAKTIGFNAVPLECSIEELKESHDICFPVMAHLKKDGIYHFVVIYNIKKNKLQIGDPSIGDIYYQSIDDFCNVWTSIIISFKKTKYFKKNKREKSKQFLSLVRQSVKQNKLAIVKIMTISFVTTVLGLFIAFSFQLLISLVISSPEHIIGEYLEEISSANGNLNLVSIGNIFLIKLSFNLVLFLKNWQNTCIFILILSICISLLTYKKNILVTVIANKTDYIINLKSFKNLIFADCNLFNNYTNGEILSRFSDIYKIRVAIIAIVSYMFSDLALIIVFSIILFFISVPLFIVCIIQAMVYGICISIFKKPIKLVNSKYQQQNSKITSMLKQIIDAIYTIKTNNSYTYFLNKFKNEENKLLNIEYSGAKLYSVQDSVVSSISSINMILIIFIGINLINLNIISIDQIIVFFIISQYILTPTIRLMNLQPEIQEALVALNRLSDIFPNDYEAIHKKKLKKIKNYNQVVSLSNISLFFDNKIILENFSLDINKKNKLILCGKNGSGKTSLVKTILKYNPNYTGTIKIFDKSIDCYDEIELSMIFSYSSSDDYIFNDSFINNILMNQHYNEDLYKNIIDICDLSSTVESLPFGINTIIGENGVTLSSGQKQKICLARCLMRNTPCIIFDESLSNVDMISKKKILNKLIPFIKNKTCIFISHDSSVFEKTSFIKINL